MTFMQTVEQKYSFFCTVQEWNSLSSEIMESATKSIFHVKLIKHIKHEVFKTVDDDT